MVPGIAMPQKVEPLEFVEVAVGFTIEMRKRALLVVRAKPAPYATLDVAYCSLPTGTVDVVETGQDGNPGQRSRPERFSLRPTFPVAARLVEVERVALFVPGLKEPKLMAVLFNWTARKLATSLPLAASVRVLVAPWSSVACTLTSQFWAKNCVSLASVPSVGSATYQSGNVQVHVAEIELEPLQDPASCEHEKFHVDVPIAAG
jgi:hypothetical protein